MSVLSALLARDRVVSPQKIDEAIQRQVINGGDFETNLLEVGAVPEDTLAGYCAAVHDAQAVGRDEVFAASLSVLARLSKGTAEALRVVPLRAEDGRIVVAAVAPLEPEALLRLETEIGSVDVRITTPFRVAWALWKYYGIELSPRLQRLGTRLNTTASGQMAAVSLRPASVPPVPVRPSQAPPAHNKLRASVLAALSSALADERDSVLPPEANAVHEGVPRHPSLTSTLVSVLTGSTDANEPGRFSVAPARDTAPSAAPASHEPPTPIAAPVEPVAPAPIAAPAQPLEVAAPSARVLSFDQAHAIVEKAADRDAILEAVLDFAAAHAAYTAVFVIHGDVAEGLDSRGDGLDSESVRGIAVPLDAPGSFRAVRERSEPVIGMLNPSGTDALIKQDLGRHAVNNVALLPILIGGRVSLIVWADHGTRALDLTGIDRLSQLCLEASRSFERIIVERKKRRKASETAAAAAAAIASSSAPTVTAADIQRRFAEQRGTAMLQRLATSSAPPAASTPPDETPTPAMPSSPPRARSQPPLPREEPDSANHQRLSERPTSATRFARGGRVPIAVDVIGPLPSAGIIPSDIQRAARPYDPRREPEESDTGAPLDDTSRLLAEVVRTGRLNDHTANELLGSGERVLPTVFRYFPGPTQIDRTNARTRLPPVPDIGPLLRLVAMFRQAAGPYLIEQLDSYDAERRFFATVCLGEVIFAPALQSLVSRLFDTDYPTATVAIESLRAYRKLALYDDALAGLREILRDANAPSDRRRTAANVLGELRDVLAVPALLGALEDRDGALGGIARRALVTIARQDFGQDAAAWRAWWEESRAKNRIEWLIDALLHNDAGIRHDASEELKKITGQFFGYYFNLPRRERERAHQRYVEWWERERR